MEKFQDSSSKSHSQEDNNSETQSTSSPPHFDPSESDVNHTILEIVDQEFQNLVLEEDRNQKRIENQNENDDQSVEVEVEVEETEEREAEEDTRIDKGETRKGYVVEEIETQDGLSVEAKEKEKGKKSPYPARPGEPDCAFYLKTGSCGFGSNCKFNHPPKKKHKVKSSSVESDESVQFFEEKAETPKRVGHLECKYYLTPGGCKFGKACRYHHPQEKFVVEPPEEVNFLGLPMRPGERECPFYMRTGSCKFASNCRFHHPNPTAGGSESSYGRSSSVPFHSSDPQSVGAPWSVPRPPTDASPYSNPSRPYMPPMLQPQVHSPLEWNGYRAPVNPVYPPQGMVRPLMASHLNDPNRNANGYSQYIQQMPVGEFPERPGQKECQYYMNTGDCKYKSACRFHHPKARIPKSANLSSFSLLNRPDHVACSHFSRYGSCKYGTACKYEHPPNPNTLPSPVAPASGPYPYYPNAANFGGANIPDFRDGNNALVQQSL